MMTKETTAMTNSVGKSSRSRLTMYWVMCAGRGTTVRNGHGRVNGP